jgi:hypothetical protein
MFPRIIGEIADVEVIARRLGIRELASLRKQFGGRNWRKMKGTANVELLDGSIHRTEVHWYDAHGVGRKKIKVKRLLD